MRLWAIRRVRHYRLSEAMPPGMSGKRLTDRDLYVTCPKCRERRSLLDLDTDFQLRSTRYTCPDDGELLVRVFEPSRRKLAVEVLVDGGVEITA